MTVSERVSRHSTARSWGGRS